MTVASPAKINWFLYVLNKREDGFHDILSPFQKISLYDSLRFEPADDVLLTDDSKITDNIILKAVDIMKKHLRDKKRGVHITINKEIPVSAGLGGGSSDAAMTLMTLNKLWSLDIGNDELMSVASEIGSDVPFFISDGFSIIKGRGEFIDPRNVEQTYDILLVNPGIKISTKWAYENNKDFMDINDENKIAEEFIRSYNNRDFDSMRNIMSNSLEAPVLKKYPEIKEIKANLKGAGAQLSLMSGSGSTVFGVFKDIGSATEAQKYFSEYWTRVVKTLS
ncbi:MAG: 4-(cytidine 5'-diphospho)-2-C-methyl-D-erythritol kinase [Thermodesulfovibrionales bacterium]